MRKIRIEKDITVRWSGILTNGEPVSLEERNLKLYIVNPFGSAKEVTEFSVTQNNIEFLFRAAEQKNMGVYKLKLYENYGKAGQTVLDQCEGICLVSTTCQEGGSTEGLDTETVDLQGGNLEAGVKGLSAYEIAVNNGFVGTETEWLESLQGKDGKDFTYDDFTPEQISELQRPATEAAGAANQAASKADTAAQVALEAASVTTQTDRTIKEAETLRVAAEQDRVKNELARQNAEAERESAENERSQAEQGRATAEEDRVTAESGREAAEQQRESAEQSRVTEFAQLKQESETATNNANDAAKKANDSVANMLVKTEQALTPEEETQVQTNIGVKDTINVVGVGEQQKVEYSIWKENYYRAYTKGSLVSNTSYIITNPIKVLSGDRIVFKALATSAVAILSEVLNDESHTYIRPILTGNNSNVYNEYIADRDMYIEFSLSKSDMDGFIYIQKTNLVGHPYPKGGYNRALYEAAGAVYNEETGFYELNGLTDITEEEIVRIYQKSRGLNNGLVLSNYNMNERTNFPLISNKNQAININSIDEIGYSYSYTCYTDNEIEIFNLGDGEFIFKKISVSFSFCNRLKIIKGILDINTLSFYIVFKNLPLLTTIMLKKVSKSVSFPNSPLLSKESILYMIQNSSAKEAITITLHADAYAMAMADIDIQAALAEKTFVSLASA